MIFRHVSLRLASREARHSSRRRKGQLLNRDRARVRAREIRSASPPLNWKRLSYSPPLYWIEILTVGLIRDLVLRVLNRFKEMVMGSSKR